MKFSALLALQLSLALSFPTSATGETPANSVGSRPNILYLYLDDLGWGSIGPNGQDAREAKGLPRVLTPHIDALAKAGVNFRRAYGCTVCSPARSSQQSGFHQGHTYADRNNPDNARKAMRADDRLMGDVLSEAGYVTGYWGKWGYGASADHDRPKILNLQTLPTFHGYQYVLAELHHVRAHTFFQPTLWKAPTRKDTIGGLELALNTLALYQGKASYPNLPALQNHEDYPKTAYCDDTYAFAALDFVRTQAQNYNKTGQPFFGLLACQIPHAPFDEISELPGWDQAYKGDKHFKTLSPQSKQWAAMVTRIDHHLGNLLDALDDPDNDGDRSDSVAANTLVIVQSDNGGPGGSSRTQLDSNGGLKGNKGQIWEGGIRVPLVMRWPNRITATSTMKANTSTDLVVDVTDLLPTFCELAGAEIPLGVDGVSLAPTLTGSGHQRTREFLIHEAGSSRSIIRGRHKLVATKKSLHLYDLEKDPGESTDLARSNRKLVAELKTLLDGERTGEPAWFSTTYHRWTGADRAKTSNPNHWSDYYYTNALNKTTYQQDTGAPQLSWIARMENNGTTHHTAVVDERLEVLGLKLKGSSATAKQILDLGSQTLTARNELRLAAHSSLSLDSGTISSLRWVDLQQDATLRGTGTIACHLYNAGTLVVSPSSPSTGTPNAQLKIHGNYHEFDGATLALMMGSAKSAPLQIDGSAHLTGTLAIALGSSVRPKSGDRFALLTASSVEGTFSNKDNLVEANDGTLFKLSYTPTGVTATVVKPAR